MSFSSQVQNISQIHYSKQIDQLQHQFQKQDWESNTISSQPPFEFKYHHNKHTIYQLKGSNRIFPLIILTIGSFLAVVIINICFDLHCQMQYQSLGCTINSNSLKCRYYLKCYSDSSFRYFDLQINILFFTVIQTILFFIFNLHPKIPHLQLTKFEKKQNNVKSKKK